MARSDRSRLAIVVATALGLAPGCFLVTDFDPVGAGGTASSTASAITAASGTDTTTTMTGTGGAGGMDPCPPPVAGLARFDFAGPTDTIDDMVTASDGTMFLVGRASPGSTVTGKSGLAVALDSPFLVRVKTTGSILQAPSPLPESDFRLSIALGSNTVSVLTLTAAQSSVDAFKTTDLTHVGSPYDCTVPNHDFTGGVVEADSKFALTFLTPGATVTCRGAPLTLGVMNRFVVIYFNIAGEIAYGINTLYEPRDPSLAIMGGSLFRICFKDGYCENHDTDFSWETPGSQWGTPAHVVAKVPFGALRAGGGALEDRPVMLIAGNFGADVFAGYDETGGVFAVSAGSTHALVSGFIKPADDPSALFVRIAEQGTSTWSVEPQPGKVGSWAVGGQLRGTSDDVLDGALMYRCDAFSTKVGGVVFERMW